MATGRRSSSFSPSSLPPQLEKGPGVEREDSWKNEMNSFVGGRAMSEADAEWMEDDQILLLREQQRDALKKREESYGSLRDGLPEEDPVPLRERLSQNRSRRKRKRRYGHRLESNPFMSLKRLVIGQDDDDDESSEEEEPPTKNMVYRRSGKDLAKLILLPTLYVVLMIVAIVFAFYTIDGVILSYHNRVQSVQTVEVKDRYAPIGIVILPQFSNYSYCQYRYYDDVSPHPERPPNRCNKYKLPDQCTYYNVTFNSTALINVTRFAMVFRGPTLVDCKESILLHFSINTTQREFSAVEYILFENWDHFESLQDSKKSDFLAFLEHYSDIYTFPAGFRTWVKMSYTVRLDYYKNRNKTNFNIIDNYASFNDPGEDGMYPMEVVFEWKDRYYDYIKEIVSTTAWSAFGSMCGVFITLVKAGEFGRMWVRRIRRDKQKKMLHLKMLEEKHEKDMEAYNERLKEKREMKLRKSMETTKSYNINGK